MKNTLGDLHNHLMMQLERLNDESMTKDELLQECKRADAISKVAQQANANAANIINMQRMVNTSRGDDSMFKQLGQ